MENERFSIINSGDEHEFAGDNPMLMLYTVNPDSTNTDGERNFDTTNELPAIPFGVFLPTDDVILKRESRLERGGTEMTDKLEILRILNCRWKNL